MAETYSSITLPGLRLAIARARAQAVLEELDARYEPPQWLVQLRRHAAVLVGVSLAVIGVVAAWQTYAHRRG
jgi:hypothetical protein